MIDMKTIAALCPTWKLSTDGASTTLRDYHLVVFLDRKPILLIKMMFELHPL